MDLRTYDAGPVVARVARTLDVSFDSAPAVVRKRRSLGLRTDRDTWVRIEARPLTALDRRGWNGIECSAVLGGVARPAWFQGVSWIGGGLVWRADEMELVSAEPVKPGGILAVEPDLSDSWWETFNASLTALTAHEGVTRWATRHTAFLTPARLASEIETVFGPVDTAGVEWVPAHGDLAWANLTAPECWLLDWEDWGLAPRGFDAATLWAASLAVPSLAERIVRERQPDLDSPSGVNSRLFLCAEIIDAGEYSGPLLQPAKDAAVTLLSQLRRTEA